MNHDAFTAKADHLKLSVSVTREGPEMHVVRTFEGRTQHKYLRADVHDCATVLAIGELTYLREALCSGAWRI